MYFGKKKLNLICIAFIGTLFFVCGSAQAQMPDHLYPACAQEDLSSWPLPSMTNLERESRLKWFSRYDDLKVVFHREDFGLDKCNQILGKLQKWEDVTVLQPTYTSYLPDADIAQKIAPSCPNLDIDRAYYRFGEEQKRFELRHGEEERRYPHMPRLFNSYAEDQDFQKLPRKEKEERARLFVEAVRNVEYYDLSKYLGTGVWGYFAEAAHLYRKSSVSTEYRIVTDKQCFPSFKAIQKIVNAHTCETAYGSYRPVMRLSNMTYSEHLSGKFPNASTTAFISVSGVLYRISIRWDSPIHNLASIISDHYRLPYAVYIDHITVDKQNAPTTVEGICSFSNY